MSAVSPLRDWQFSRGFDAMLAEKRQTNKAGNLLIRVEDALETILT